MREGNRISINNIEKDNAEFIIKTYNVWLSIKDELESYINKLSEVWKKETDIKNDLTYFG